MEGAGALIDGDFELEADDIDNAQHQFKINAKNTHRADRKNQTKQESKQVKKRNEEHEPNNKRSYSTTRLKEFTWIYFIVIPP